MHRRKHRTDALSSDKHKPPHGNKPGNKPVLTTQIADISFHINVNSAIRFESR
jgi:hypothetical protein